MRQNGPVETIGRAIPYNYDTAAEKSNPSKDFYGVSLPSRNPEKEFERPTRFPSHRPGDMLPQTNSTFGMPIQHESHRFGLTNALWPVENCDSQLSKYQPPMSDGDPKKVSRIYADPRQADLAYKLEDRRRLSQPFYNTDHRKMKMSRTSKGRRSLNFNFPFS